MGRRWAGDGPGQLISVHLSHSVLSPHARCTWAGMVSCRTGYRIGSIRGSQSKSLWDSFCVTRLDFGHEHRQASEALTSRSTDLLGLLPLAAPTLLAGQLSRALGFAPLGCSWTCTCQEGRL